MLRIRTTTGAAFCSEQQRCYEVYLHRTCIEQIWFFARALNDVSQAPPLPPEVLWKFQYEDRFSKTNKHSLWRHSYNALTAISACNVEAGSVIQTHSSWNYCTTHNYFALKRRFAAIQHETQAYILPPHGNHRICALEILTFLVLFCPIGVCAPKTSGSWEPSANKKRFCKRK